VEEKLDAKHEIILEAIFEEKLDAKVEVVVEAIVEEILEAILSAKEQKYDTIGAKDEVP